MKMPNLPSSYHAGTVKPSSEPHDGANGPFATTSSTVRTISATRASNDGAGVCDRAGAAVIVSARNSNPVARLVIAAKVYPNRCILGRGGGEERLIKLVRLVALIGLVRLVRLVALIG